MKPIKTKKCEANTLYVGEVFVFLCSMTHLARLESSVALRKQVRGWLSSIEISSLEWSIMISLPTSVDSSAEHNFQTCPLNQTQTCKHYKSGGVLILWMNVTYSTLNFGDLRQQQGNQSELLPHLKWLLIIPGLSSIIHLLTVGRFNQPRVRSHLYDGVLIWKGLYR